ncbi:MAG: extensin family protein [Pseudomonadota bacterium]
MSTVVLAAVLSGAVAASPVPPVRPGAEIAPAEDTRALEQDTATAVLSMALPRVRPARPTPPAQQNPSTAGVRRDTKTGRIWKRAPKLSPDKAAAIRAAIERDGRLYPCSDARLTGTMLEPIQNANRICGIVQPVRLTQVAGVAIRPAAVLECRTARLLADWIEQTALPAATERLGSPLTRISTMGSYVCRTRNHRPGARLSEHGFGRAIDIGTLVLADNRQVSVASDWGRGAEGAYLADLHKGACGPFKTVLGPEADPQHADHFHFDAALRSGRPYCR